MRGIRSAAEEMGILQADPQGPERRAQGEVLQDVCWRGPAATDEIAQTHSALVHTHADVEHQEPFGDEHGDVTRHSVLVRGGWLGVLLCSVLEETASDGQPYKNGNEHNRVPGRGDERAAGWGRWEVRLCGHGDDASANGGAGGK